MSQNRTMKHSIRLFALAVACLVGFAWPSSAGAAPQRGEPKVTAQLATGVVKFGGDLRCVVQVEDAKHARIVDIPEVEGLRLERTSSPSINSATSVVNGRIRSRRTVSWVLTFRPERQGEFLIPPMMLEVDGKTAFTRELTLSVVEDLTGEEFGYLEFLERPERVYEGQPFTLRLHLGWDRKLDARVNYANLILPWWNELPGTLEVDSGAPGVGAPTVDLQVNNRMRVRAIDLGEMEVRDTPFRVLELRRSYVATRSGRLEFPQSWLEFGQVRNRVFSQQKETYHVGVPAFSLEVRTLPEAGRPPEFSGGVGRFEVQADVNRRDLDLGESLKLTVDWTGEANLEFFELPNPGRLEAFDEFRVYGTTNERFYGDRRRVVYDMAPKDADVFEVPSLPLVVFDPESERYETVVTDPIPIRVRALEGTTELDAEGEEGAGYAPRDIQTRPETAADGSELGTGVLVSGWLGLPLLWLVGRGLVRRRGDPDAPAARRRRAARRRLARDLRGARSAGEQASALYAFLAARSEEEPEAWEGRNVRAWLRERERELPEESLAELLAVEEELDRRRWAGDDAALEDSRLVALGDALTRGGL